MEALQSKPRHEKTLEVLNLHSVCVSWSIFSEKKQHICFRYGPLPVAVTIRIITCLLGDFYKPSFATITGRGPHPTHVTSFLGIAAT